VLVGERQVAVSGQASVYNVAADELTNQFAAGYRTGPWSSSAVVNGGSSSSWYQPVGGVTGAIGDAALNGGLMTGYQTVGGVTGITQGQL